jgi:hypothetical protein
MPSIHAQILPEIGSGADRAASPIVTIHATETCENHDISRFADMKRFTSALLVVLLVACGGTQPMPFQTTDTTAGGGAEAASGRRVVVHYTGWLYEPSAADKKGTKFDSSRDRNEPFEFNLGAGEVIRGWDEGVKGMKVGGKRVLTIPPDMGYGARGAGGVIPPNATLLFEVELLDVR